MKDLHLHLSGATSPVLLFEMICETGIKMKTKQYEQFVDTLLMNGKVNNLGTTSIPEIESYISSGNGPLVYEDIDDYDMDADYEDELDDEDIDASHIKDEAPKGGIEDLLRALLDD